MVERFVLSIGTISIDNGSSTVTGDGTTFSLLDQGGAQLWAHPTGLPAIRVGSVADLADPEDLYENFELPLVHPYEGDDLVDVPFELVYGMAQAKGYIQALAYAKFNAWLRQYAGLAFNFADDIDLSLIPNNSIGVDAPARTLKQYRNGEMETIFTVGQAFLPKGLWSAVTSYDTDFVVNFGNFLFVSNQDDNVNHQPQISAGGAPINDAFWTWLPLPTPEAFYAGWNVVFDASGSDISTGVAGDMPVPFDVELLSWTIVADGTGTISIEVWKDILANYPPTVADKISASAPIALTGQNRNSDAALIGWTTNWARDDVLRFNITASSGITRVTISFTVQRVWPVT
jgi:hypothetical protein